jgi:uncharacterized protein YfaP (DUF2135 family)
MMSFIRFALLLLAPLAGVTAYGADRPTMDNPRGGWRASASSGNEFVQPVHYPAANVNTEGISAGALIAGRIRGYISAAPKGQRDAARLVVDGIALPLDVREGGAFARPWSFGPGAHGVSVRAPGGNGAPERRVQFYEANATRVAPRLRVALSWDTDMTDLDLHVVSPDGQHVWYGARVAPNGGALDVDVTTGFGPEIYANPAPVPGIYNIYVNYYGTGEQRGTITVAQIAFIQDEGTPREKQRVFRVPMRKPGELTLVSSFVIP